MSPAIAADGRIVLALSYVPGGVYALAPPAGNQAWDQLLDGGVFGVGPAIGVAISP